MASDRSLNYSLKVYHESYKIIENFVSCGYYYCLCDLYQECQARGDFLAGAHTLLLYLSSF